MQAVYDTFAQHPEVPQQFVNDLVDAVSDAFESLFQAISDLAEATLNLAGNAIADLIDGLLNNIPSPLADFVRDPLVLDLDGDGIEVSSLSSSSIYFDFSGGGHPERTGWVDADDGILAIDLNNNGTIDNGLELFGSSQQDGFAVLEKLDSNGDGKIDAADDDFDKLLIWRDINQNGISEASELFSLGDLGVTSISLNRHDVRGLNNGNDIGYEAVFERLNGSSGIAQTINFATDTQDTIDHTPGFTPAVGVDLLPQLPGSGTIYSIAYRASMDSAFRAQWTSLTDAASTMSIGDLRQQFEVMLLRWAGVEETTSGSRGPYVDAAHLAFIEAFFGDTYRQLQWGEEVRTFPNTRTAGVVLEANYQAIVTVLETAFLAQVGHSLAVRGVYDAEDALVNPYIFYGLLDFSVPEVGEPAPETPANVGMVLSLIVAFLPTVEGQAADYLTKALRGLEGIVLTSFHGDRGAYMDVVGPYLDGISDDVLKQLGVAIVGGDALIGSVRAEGIVGDDDDNVIIGAGGGDVVSGGAGSDIYVYAKGDGDLWIKDSGSSLVDTDRLLLTDLNSSDVTFERIGDDLRIKITSTGKTIVSEDFFLDFTTQRYGIDVIRFADGTEWDRVQIKGASLYKGDGQNNLIQDSDLDDVIYAGKGDDLIQISKGNDIILYAKGDGYDVIQDRNTASTGREVLKLIDLNSTDIELSRNSSNSLFLTVKSTGEYIQIDSFFTPYGSEWPTYKGNIDEIHFANGEVWNRNDIQSNAWYRGTDRGEVISGADLNDTIEGGKGIDILDGRAGSDTYVWRKGDGNDQITDSGSSAGDVDTLYLVDVMPDGVAFSYQGNTLLITVKSTGEVIRVLNFFSGVSNLTQNAYASRAGIDVIKFANGGTLDRQQIFTLTGEQFLGKDREILASYITVEGVKTLVSMYFVDEFGHSGDIVANLAPGFDDVYDQQFHNVLNWDFNIGEANNVLNGGAGNNNLAGGGGQDVLYGGSGEGKDILYGDRPGDASFGDSDLLDGGAGADMLFGGGGSDFLNGGLGNDYLSGDDGADILDGSLGDDIFVGGKGDDYLINSPSVTGSSGNDTYVYFLGDGNDIILESSDNDKRETDVLSFADLNPDGIELLRVGNDLDIRIRATGEIIKVISQFAVTSDSIAPGQGIEVIRFAGGLEWDRLEIQQNAWYRGTDGRDVIVTGSNAFDHNGNRLSETLEGGKGDDIFYTGYQGASGNDTFIYSRGDGNDVVYEQTWRSTLGTTHNETDTLKFTDIDSSDVQLTRSGKDLFVTIISTNETITVVDQFAADVSAPGEGVELIRFANGEVWGRDRIQQEAWFRGTDGRDFIDLQVSSWNDIVEGGRGTISLSQPIWLRPVVIPTYMQKETATTLFLTERGRASHLLKPTFSSSRISTPRMSRCRDQAKTF